MLNFIICLQLAGLLSSISRAFVFNTINYSFWEEKCCKKYRVVQKQKKCQNLENKLKGGIQKYLF